MRVAVIGSGIAGLGAAHALQRVHDVEVFERDGRAGGHANTVDVDRGDGSLLALDTGFLVHNRHNYPLLTRLFGDLQVRTQDSDMSFGVSCATFAGDGRPMKWRNGSLYERATFKYVLNSSGVSYSAAMWLSTWVGLIPIA